jgi:hypothetical protein
LSALLKQGCALKVEIGSGKARYVLEQNGEIGLAVAIGIAFDGSIGAHDFVVQFALVVMEFGGPDKGGSENSSNC